MKKSHLFLSLVLFAFLMPKTSSAQDKLSPFPQIAVGLSPSSLANVYTGPQASLDYRISNNLNSANEATYIIGLFNTPGFRVKSGLQFFMKGFKGGFLTLGPNLIYQRVSTDIWFNSPLTFSDRANQLEIDFIESRIAADALGSVRINLSKKLFLEFGLGAGVHYTIEKVTDTTANNLKTLLTEEPEYTFEEREKSMTVGLLTSFNLNLSYVIAQ